MLPASKRLSAQEFTQLFTQPKRVDGALCQLVYKQGMPQTKAGIAIAKKLKQNAVSRNRLRRRMYELLRTHWDTLPQGVHVVVAYKAPGVKASHRELGEEIENLIQKLK